MLEPHDYAAWMYRQRIDYRRNGLPQGGSSTTIQPYGNDALETTNNPNYDVMIQKHQDAGSPYLRKKVKKFSPLYATASSRTIGDSGFYTGLLNIIPSTFSQSDLTYNVTADLVPYRDQALRHLKNKLSSKSGKYQALIPAVEFRDMHKTYQGMCKTTERFIIGTLDAKRRLFKNPKRAIANFTEFLSDAWLTYSFGIAPTVSDFEAAAESAAWRLTRTRTLRETGGMGITTQRNVAQDLYLCGNFSDPSYNIRLKVRGSFQNTVTYFFTGGRFIDLDGSSGMSISDQFGVSWGQVIPAIYETFPYSWLIDYFTTAGDIINETFESPAGTTVYNYETRVHEFNLNASVAPEVGSRVYNQVVNIHWVPVVQGINIRRLRLANLPHQSLRFKTFDEISVNAGNRLRNLFSLASPILSRRLRK